MSFDAFPVFKPNQVLTANHLNDLRVFLDCEDRLTRRALIGIGVLCGFDLDVDDQSRVLISKGVAVTSGGYLIAENTVTCDRFRPYEVPIPTGDEVTPAQVDEAQYLFLFPDGENQTDAWEMLTTEAEIPAGEADPEALTAAFLADKTVMLFLEMTEESLKNCDINDCSDKGAELQFVLRRLLVRRADADAMMAQEAQIAGFPTDRANQPGLALKFLRVEDLALARSGIGTYPALFARILQIAGRLTMELPSALRDAWAAYRHFLVDMFPEDAFPDPNGPFVDDYFGNVWGNLAVQPYLAQYFYDYMLDVVMAYNEFVAAARAFVAECLPNPDRFPKHVLLGDPVARPIGSGVVISSPAEFFAFDPLTASTGLGPHPRPVLRRTDWTPAAQGPAYADMRALFYRLVLLGQNFQLRELLGTQIRVTPSRHGAAAMGTRAISPFYAVSINADLFRVWSPEKTRANLLSTVYSHTFSTPDSNHPYFYRIDGEDFYAIAGHVGKSLDRVMAELIVHKRVLGLEFAIEPVWMGLALANDVEARAIDRATARRALVALRRLILCRMGDFEVVLLTLLAALFALLVFIIRGVGRQNALAHAVPQGIGLAAETAAATPSTQPDTPGLALAIEDIQRLVALSRIDAVRRPDRFSFTALRLQPAEREELRVVSKDLLENFRTIPPIKGAATEALVGQTDNTSVATIFRSTTADPGSDSLFEKVQRQVATLDIANADRPAASEMMFKAVAVIDAAETLMEKTSVSKLADFDADEFETAFVGFSDRLTAYAATAPVDPAAVGQSGATTNVAVGDYAGAISAQTIAFGSGGLLGEMQRRIVAIFNDLTLSGYARRHPGLKHCAGVPKGGTLVLAYASKTELEAMIRRAAPQFDRLSTTLSAPLAQGALTASIATATAQVLQAAGPSGRDPLSEFFVLADFCLDHQCCDSDCSDIELEGDLPDDLFDLDTPGSMGVDPILPGATPTPPRPGIGLPNDNLDSILNDIGVARRPVLTPRQPIVRVADTLAHRSVPAPQPRGTGRVTGRVTGLGSASNTLISPASVVVNAEDGQTTRIDAPGGTFETRLPAGTFRLTPRADGFVGIERTVEVTTNGSISTTLRMRRDN